jgi:transcriptional regulator with XRE-family HTH domain
MAPELYSTDWVEVVGANIRRLREARWKGNEFAALVGISESHLSRIERGERLAHPSVYHRAAGVLGVTVDSLAVDNPKVGAA